MVNMQYSPCTDICPWALSVARTFENCVYYPSNIFRNTRGFENWGMLLRIFLSFSWGIFSHVTRLDQSRMSENI